jgi:type IV pilus assembly protein PilA
MGRSLLWVGLFAVGLLACKDAPTEGSPAPGSAPLEAPLEAPSSPTVPSVTTVLSAENTMGFVALERLDALGTEAERMLTHLPPEGLAELPASLRDAATRRATLGFDPTQASGFGEVGLDAQAGIALAFDQRLKGRPVLALRVTDEGKLRAALARAGVVVDAPSPAGALQQTRINQVPALLARRGAWTLVLPEADVAADEALLAAVAREDAPLSEHPSLRTAFMDGVQPLWISAWVSTSALVERLRAAEVAPAEVASAAFYAERFPAAAFAFGSGQGALRILTSPAALASVHKLFVPRHPVPDFAKNLNELMAFRLDINFGQFFEGLEELIPPEETEARQSLAMGRVALPQLVGFTFEELDAALSGHVFVQYKAPQPMQPPQAALAFGVVDEQRTDEVVARVATMVAHRMGVSTTPVQVAGREARVFDAGLYKVVVLRDGKRLWLGDQASVEAALAGGKAPPALGEKINQSAVLAAFFSLEPMVTLVAGTLRSDDAATMQAMAALWRPYLVDGWLVNNLRIDARGLKLGEGAGGAAVPGVLAAVAIPAFVKYVRRSKVSEASVNLHRMVMGIKIHHRELGKLPESAPLTPSAAACVGGKPGTQLTDKAQWQGPWEVIGFATTDKIRYQYEYLSDGQSFTARAIGDLDCDGVFATFERVGRVEADGTLNISAGMQMINELE